MWKTGIIQEKEVFIFLLFIFLCFSQIFSMYYAGRYLIILWIEKKRGSQKSYYRNGVRCFGVFVSSVCLSIGLFYKMLHTLYTVGIFYTYFPVDGTMVLQFRLPSAIPEAPCEVFYGYVRIYLVSLPFSLTLRLSFLPGPLFAFIINDDIIDMFCVQACLSYWLIFICNIYKYYL